MINVPNLNTNKILNTIKISDASGALSGSGAAISIKAWDVNGKSLVESAIVTKFSWILLQ